MKKFHLVTFYYHIVSQKKVDLRNKGIIDKIVYHIIAAILLNISPD